MGGSPEDVLSSACFEEPGATVGALDADALSTFRSRLSGTAGADFCERQRTPAVASDAKLRMATSACGLEMREGGASVCRASLARASCTASAELRPSAAGCGWD